jgi:hypothetical protein
MLNSILNLQSAKRLFLIIVCASGLSISTAQATTSTADLSGFIQNGTIANDIGSGANITQIIYSLGTPGPGIATWDASSFFAGGTPSDFLFGPDFFQTVTWSGLSVAPGSSFNFSGLDIDLIISLVPLNVTGGILDETGSSLVNASLTVFWSNGDIGSSPLVQQAWSTNQHLTISGRAAGVPDAASTQLLLAIGLAGLAVCRRVRRG